MDFSALAARVDALEDIAWNQPGGSTEEQNAAVVRAEAELFAVLASTPAERLWLVQRLERAVGNEWSPEAKAPLIGALSASYLAAESE